MAVFDRGDMVQVPLDPAIGHEQRGTRHAGFAVSLDASGCRTQGAALVNKIRMLDLSAGKARKVERVPQAVIDDALGRVTAILDE